MSVNIKPLSDWSKTLKKKLSSSLHVHETSKWYTQMTQIAFSWKSSPSASLSFQSRWGEFTHHESDSLFLRYDPDYSDEDKDQSQRQMKNLFSMLSGDFRDKKTPIGSLIHAFTKEFLMEFEEVERAACSDRKAAASHLGSLCSLLLRLSQVLASTSATLYEQVSMRLLRRRSDLEGLLLAHIMTKEMYRLIEDLAVASTQESIEVLAGVCGREVGDFNLRQEDFSHFTLQVCAEMQEILRRITRSENFYCRRKWLFRLTETLAKVSDEEGVRADVMLWVVATCGIPRLPAHVCATKQLIIDEPEALALLAKAICRLTPNVDHL